MEEKAFISYIDDGENVVRGFFTLKEVSDNYIVIISGKNEITLPYHRILKMKKEMK